MRGDPNLTSRISPDAVPFIGILKSRLHTTWSSAVRAEPVGRLLWAQSG
jgi:hypothetical protein